MRVSVHYESKNYAEQATNISAFLLRDRLGRSHIVGTENILSGGTVYAVSRIGDSSFNNLLSDPAFTYLILPATARGQFGLICIPRLGGGSMKVFEGIDSLVVHANAPNEQDNPFFLAYVPEDDNNVFHSVNYSDPSFQDRVREHIQYHAQSYYTRTIFN